jgi:adenylate cyclase
VVTISLALAEHEDERRFEQALDRQILDSERVRSTALACIFAALFAFFLLATTTFAAEGFLEVFEGRLSRITVAGFLGTAALLEFLSRTGLGIAIRRQRRPNPFIRYASALVEVSLPTFAIWYIGTNVFHPLHVLVGPTPFMYFLFIIASVLRLDPGVSLFTGLVAAAEFLLLVSWAYSHGTPEGPAVVYAVTAHRGRVFLLLLSGFIAAWVAKRLRDDVLRNMLRDTLRAERDRGDIQRVFGQHVSPKVVDRLLQQRGELPSELRYVCVMFLDIRDFTAFAERRRPEEVVTYLNALFGYMIDAVNQNNGIVNKFLGDGFMAVFGAPFSDGQECRNAITAAREILAKTAALAPDLPPPRIGIGLHAGEAVTGHIGSADRKEYTIIGDVVNLASRIESLNKEFGTQLLCSAEVMKSAGEAAAGAATSRGTAKVKGRESGVEVFQLG